MTLRHPVPLLATILLALSAVASDADAEYAAAAAADVSATPSLGGHGIAILDAKTELEKHDAVIHAQLNTDTLRLSVERLRLDDGMTLDVGVAGEALIAGLLTDYYRAGELQPEYGFFASWISAHTELKRRLSHHDFLHWRVTPRVWLFGPRTDTLSPNVLLPDTFVVLEQTLGFTHWNFAPDPSHHEAHRWFRRLDGFGFGFAADFHFRSQAIRWVTDNIFRNNPDQTISIFRQWAALGAPLGDSMRFQLRQEARAGWGEDDLTRRRIGGMNPYSVRLAGAPWPAFLSSRTASVHPSLHWNAFGDTEVGVLLDVVALNDPARDGSADTYGVLGGGGLFLDYRRDEWQADARVGVLAPSQWMERGPHIGGFIGVGRSL